jgi:hypothetical protein
MKFDEWFNRSGLSLDLKTAAYIGWVACKQQCVDAATEQIKLQCNASADEKVILQAIYSRNAVSNVDT